MDGSLPWLQHAALWFFWYLIPSKPLQGPGASLPPSMCLEWVYSSLFFSLALCIFIKGLESWYPIKMQSTIIINDTVSKKDICYFYSIGFPWEQKHFFFFGHSVNVPSLQLWSSVICFGGIVVPLFQATPCLFLCNVDTIRAQVASWSR